MKKTIVILHCLFICCASKEAHSSSDVFIPLDVPQDFVTKQAKRWKENVIFTDKTNSNLFLLKTNGTIEELIAEPSTISSYEVFDDTLHYLITSEKGIRTIAFSLVSKKKVKSHDHYIKEFTSLRTIPYIVSKNRFAFYDRLREQLYLRNMFSDSTVSLQLERKNLRTRCVLCESEAAVSMLVSLKDSSKPAYTWRLLKFSKGQTDEIVFDEILTSIYDITRSTLFLTCDAIYLFNRNQDNSFLLKISQKNFAIDTLYKFDTESILYSIDGEGILVKDGKGFRILKRN